MTARNNINVCPSEKFWVYSRAVVAIARSLEATRRKSKKLNSYHRLLLIMKLVRIIYAIIKGNLKLSAYEKNPKNSHQ
jgi:hypothetical protein